MERWGLTRMPLPHTNFHWKLWFYKNSYEIQWECRRVLYVTRFAGWRFFILVVYWESMWSSVQVYHLCIFLVRGTLHNRYTSLCSGQATWYLKHFLLSNFNPFKLYLQNRTSYKEVLEVIEASRHNQWPVQHKWKKESSSFLEPDGWNNMSHHSQY